MIIFDLDDTLIDTTGSITPFQLEKALRAMIEGGLKVGSFEQALMTLKRLDLSSESASQTLHEFLELIDGDLNLLKVGEEVVYGEIPDHLAVSQLEYASQVLENLKENHPLALVSIGVPHFQLLKMKNAGLDSTIFSKIIISKQKDKKPAYEEILGELNIPPAKTMVCGDRVHRDLTPAKQLGCRTIQMRWGRGLCNNKDFRDVDFTISRLSQIQDIVEGL